MTEDRPSLAIGGYPGVVENVSPGLTLGECHVWFAPTAPDAWIARLINGDERVQMEGMRSKRAATTFLMRRALCRAVIALYLGAAPTEIVISRKCTICGHPAHGKPHILGPARMQFSVSGSNGAAVVAIRAQGKVGIDLELDDRKRTFDRLLQAFNQEFARGAMADGGSVPGIPSHRDLLQVWTRKEAAVKALGAGMAVPLRDVIVTPAQELPRLISLPESSLTGLGISDFKLNPLQMSDVDLPSPWIGSIAYTGQLDSIEYFNGVAALRQMSEGSS